MTEPNLFEDEAEQPLVKKRKVASKSPMQRTLAELRKQGAVCGIVEKFNKFANVRQDLFGCIDIVALRDNAIVGVQCTSASNHADHLKKCIAEPRLTTWLQCGGKFEVWSWRKSKPRGAKRELWTARVDSIQMPQCARSNPSLWQLET